jgi:hypothetical protein
VCVVYKLYNLFIEASFSTGRALWLTTTLCVCGRRGQAGLPQNSHGLLRRLLEPRGGGAIILGYHHRIASSAGSSVIFYIRISTRAVDNYMYSMLIGPGQRCGTLQSPCTAL